MLRVVVRQRLAEVVDALGDTVYCPKAFSCHASQLQQKSQKTDIVYG
jgi:hypothetical protein